MTVEVELLWFAGCPNWRETCARLRQALPLAGRQQGPFAEDDDPVGLSCRVFRTPDGLRGAPTVEQLVVALSDL